MQYATLRNVSLISGASWVQYKSHNISFSAQVVIIIVRSASDPMAEYHCSKLMMSPAHEAITTNVRACIESG